MRSACCCNTLSRRLSMEGQLLPASRHAAACAAAPLTRACSCLSKRAWLALGLGLSKRASSSPIPPLYLPYISRLELRGRQAQDLLFRSAQHLLRVRGGLGVRVRISEVRSTSARRRLGLGLGIQSRSIVSRSTSATRRRRADVAASSSAGFPPSSSAPWLRPSTVSRLASSAIPG